MVGRNAINLFSGDASLWVIIVLGSGVNASIIDKFVVEDCIFILFVIIFGYFYVKYWYYGEILV